jgi:hypothetical protein
MTDIFQSCAIHPTVASVQNGLWSELLQNKLIPLSTTALPLSSTILLPLTLSCPCFATGEFAGAFAFPGLGSWGSTEFVWANTPAAETEISKDA